MITNVSRIAGKATIGALVVVGGILLWNDLYPVGFLGTRQSIKPAQTSHGAGPGLHVNLSTAKQAFDSQDVVFIDARSSSEYSAGHIPGALNVPPSDFSRSKALATLKPNQTIITYCSGEACQSSIVLAEMLIGVRGQINTRVFFGGWEAWRAAAYPVATGNSP